MGSHSTWYALIVPRISECWPEDSLTNRNMLPQNTNIYTPFLCFDSNFKTFCFNFEFKHNGMCSLKIKLVLLLNLIWIVRCEVLSAVLLVLALLQLVHSPDVANDSGAFILKVFNYLILQMKTLRPSQRLKLYQSTRRSILSSQPRLNLCS
jgi:hypothetical protein